MLVFFPGNTQAGADGLTILSPPDHSGVEGRLVNLIFSTGELKPDAIRVTANGHYLPAILNIGERQTFCLEGVELADGFNTISVVPLKNGQPLDNKTVNVYRRSDLSWKFNHFPPGFNPYIFHVPKNEEKCRDCHGKDINTIPSANPASPEQSSCFLCHQGILKGKFVHGPASVWSCVSCHDPKSTGTRFRTVQPTEALCSGCHDSDSWTPRNYPHGPVAMGMCTACHDPHMSDFPFFLRMKTTDLCSACHEDTASRPHVISFFTSGKGHPVYLKENPFQPDTEFNCASCHNPHGGSFPYILRKEYTSMRTYCTTCHEFNLRQ